MSIAIVILAAGQGTRMNSDLPKVLHRLGGTPLLTHAMRAGESVEPSQIIVVTGTGAEAVEAAARDWNDAVVTVRQEEQLGTGNAVAQAKKLLAGFVGDVIVLFGDTPFIAPETLQNMLKARAKGADVVALGFEATDPGRYGRLIAKGKVLERIVEAADASAAELKINLCNSGVFCADAKQLFELVDAVGKDNKAGEYYLTDIVGLARDRALKCEVVVCAEAETLGINTRAELAAAEIAFQTRARAEALENGVTMAAPETIFFALDTIIGRDALIEPYVVFGPGVTVETDATIRSFSHLEGCHVSQGAIIGPFARLRNGAEIGEAARIGNFVEVKAALVEDGAKINHLSYVGDAHIGKAANLGAGTITCNYDGVFKHQTVVGAGAFIGSNSALVAPVNIGAGAMIGAGSTITMDVPADALSLGRARQEIKPGLARRLFERLRAAKARGIH